MHRAALGRVITGFLLVGVVLGGMVSPGRAQIPSESDVHVDYGVLAYDAKRYNEALLAFQDALRLNPENVNALYYTGLTYLALDQYPPAQAALEQAHKLAPSDLDVAFQLGVAYFLQQKFDQAEPLFQQVYARQPKRPNVGYYLGILEYRQQAYREALRFFQANVPSDENFSQLTRFYTGLALSALGLADQARAEIEEAVRLQPISPLTGPADRLREVLGAAAKGERNFHVDAKLSFFYDDNVPVNPDVSSDPSAQIAREKKHRSTGELGFLRLEYLPLRTLDWEATLAYAVLQTINNDVAHFNVQNHTGTASLSYKTSIRRMPTVTGLTYQYDYISLDDRNFVSRHTVAPFLTLAWDARHLTQGQLRFQDKDFMHEKTLVSPEDDRDARNYMAGITHFLRFAGDQHFIKMGYQIDWEEAQGSNWTYLGHRFLVGGQYTLPWGGIRLRYDFDAHLRDYRNRHTFLPTGIITPTVHRSDKDMNHQFSVSKDLPWNLTLSLEYLLNMNVSNLALFDYTRNVVSLSMSWRY